MHKLNKVSLNIMFHLSTKMYVIFFLQNIRLRAEGYDKNN